MSVIRSIFILGLCVCVGYSGYVIYLKHYSDTADMQQRGAREEAPLFEPAPMAPAANDAPPLAPTVVLSTNVAETPLPTPAEPEAEETAFEAPPQVQPSANAGLEELTPGEMFAEAEQSLAAGSSLRAYRLLSTLIRRDDLSAEERSKTAALLEPLAAKIVFAPNKHLALPALTIKPGMTLEKIAEERQIPVPFLRAINGLTSDESPESGDVLKVIEGPLELQLHADRNELTLWVGHGFARRFACKHLPPALKNGTTAVQRADTPEQISLMLHGEALIDEKDETEEGPWRQIAPWLGAETKLVVAGVAQAQADNLAAQPTGEAKVVSAEAPAAESMLPETDQTTLDPIDALRVEVFSPPKPIAVGGGANFGLRIINLSDKPAPEVSAIVFFSEGLEPVKIEGAEGKVAVGQAEFRSIRIPSREHVDLQVLATVNDFGRQVYRVEVRCDAWDAHLVSEVAVSALGKAPEPPALELSDDPQAPSQR
ncbi:MAG: LysM peptidoglycan-binding domain-containing protein [Blastopirellula sp. JB062]